MRFVIFLAFSLINTFQAVLPYRGHVNQLLTTLIVAEGNREEPSKPKLKISGVK